MVHFETKIAFIHHPFPILDKWVWTGGGKHAIRKPTGRFHNLLFKNRFHRKWYPNQRGIDFEKYLEALGVPDKGLRGGPGGILSGFGCEDFSLAYCKNEIWAGHCFLSEAYLRERGVNIFGLEVGDSREKVEKTFLIDTKKRKKIRVWGNSDAILNIHFDLNDRVVGMRFFQDVTLYRQCLTMPKPIGRPFSTN
ncbi:hypothetical protein [Robiginitalea marina]|uniref:Uncharacterized protein n=1 Tax=Robiginitalea marina TaxID=2954105 RepID=A0ABT1AX20_9FLAO|nr:hypothetical protein [Robiginitalea marina]MCO5723893.1 hypothetical protein [Robiginitalea marina]